MIKNKKLEINKIKSFFQNLFSLHFFYKTYNSIKNIGNDKCNSASELPSVRLVNIISATYILLVILFFIIYYYLNFVNLLIYLSIGLIGLFLVLYQNHIGKFIEAKFILLLDSNFILFFPLKTFGYETGFMYYYSILILQSYFFFQKKEKNFHYLFLFSLFCSFVLLEIEFINKIISDNDQLLISHLFNISGVVIVSVVSIITFQLYIQTIQIPDEYLREQLKLKKLLESEISEKQDIEKSIQFFQQFQADIIDLIPSFIFIINENGKIIKKNKQSNFNLNHLNDFFSNYHIGDCIFLAIEQKYSKFIFKSNDFISNIKNILSGDLNYFEENFHFTNENKKIIYSIRVYPILLEFERGAIIFHSDISDSFKNKNDN
jgi:hypothetical protein